MTAATYPARHEAIRKALMERGYRLINGPNVHLEAWEKPSVVDDRGSAVVLWLPVYPFADYGDLCNAIEIALGMRLPPEAQRAVDAERARCVAVLDRGIEQCNRDQRSPLAVLLRRVLEEIKSSIESGEGPA